MPRSFSQKLTTAAATIRIFVASTVSATNAATNDDIFLINGVVSRHGVNKQKVCDMVGFR
jgi:hypothetical protein